MKWFGKKEKTVDLTEKYDRHVERMQNIRGIVNKAEGINARPTQLSQVQPTQTSNSFSFLRDMASSSSPVNSYAENEDSDEKKRKLAKRLADITDKLEDLSTQIYHLQQRVELLERKNNVGIE